MKFRIRHVTTYHYSDPVLLSHHAAHLCPRDMAGQSHQNARLDISPVPAVMHDQQTDYFGNPVVHFTIQDAHTTLQVTTRFQVETSPQPSLPQSCPWEMARLDLGLLGLPEDPGAMDFVFASPQLPYLPEAAEYAAPSFTPGRPLAEAVLDLTRRIHADFAFDPVATQVGTPLSTVFSQRRGVCQDFAHVGIACVRAMGLAARYVSGYIRTLPPPGKEKLIGADASHAWLSVHIPGWGWLDLDPTNDTIAGEDHITVAWGRDYDDVSPIRGVVLGGGEHGISVAVDVFEIV